MDKKKDIKQNITNEKSTDPLQKNDSLKNHSQYLHQKMDVKTETDASKHLTMQQYIKKLTDLEQEIKKLKDQILREKAENENLRKRNVKVVEEATNFAISSFARDLTDTMENLIRALNSIKKEELANNKHLLALFEGIEMTRKNMQNCFNKYDIERLYPAGQQFNHNFHQAVSQVTDNKKIPNSVVDVIQAGYTIKNRLLKPAMVIVSKKT